MTTKIGAEFSEVRPKNLQGRIPVAGSSATPAINLGLSTGLENGTIIRVAPLDAFKPGQQVLFWLTIYNGSTAGAVNPYISRVRLKPWWLRPNNEFRSPGMNPGPGDLGLGNTPPYSSNPEGWKMIDEQTFGGGTYVNNRQCWFPGVKMMDVTEFQTVNPPPAAPARQSDSLFLDELWTLDLQSPNTAAAQALPLVVTPPAIGTSQVLVGRGVVFLFIAKGYSLGFTHEVTMSAAGAELPLTLDLTWTTGTL